MKPIAEVELTIARILSSLAEPEAWKPPLHHRSTVGAASAAIPLASRDQRVAILPSSYGVDDLREVVASFDTVVLMKVSGTLLQAVEELQELEPAHKSVLVKRATTQEQQVIRDPLQLSPKELDYFSLLIITREGGHGQAKR